MSFVTRPEMSKYPRESNIGSVVRFLFYVVSGMTYKDKCTVRHLECSVCKLRTIPLVGRRTIGCSTPHSIGNQKVGYEE